MNDKYQTLECRHSFCHNLRFSCVGLFSLYAQLRSKFIDGISRIYFLIRQNECNLRTLGNGHSSWNAPAHHRHRVTMVTAMVAIDIIFAGQGCYSLNISLTPRGIAACTASTVGGVDLAIAEPGLLFSPQTCCVSTDSNLMQ